MSVISRPALPGFLIGEFMNNMAWIADDGHCVGFIIRRGKTGFEAFTSDEKSLGVFPTKPAAARAVFQKEDLHDADICKQA